MREPFRVISCPNCGGDEEPWFMTAEGCEDTYVHTCGKCLHVYCYYDRDVRDWHTGERVK